jgi:hypothetical protein
MAAAAADTAAAIAPIADQLSESMRVSANDLGLVRATAESLLQPAGERARPPSPGGGSGKGRPQRALAAWLAEQDKLLLEADGRKLYLLMEIRSKT